MAQKTLLQIVQSVLASIGGDQVNSINDTEESAQIVEVIQDVWDEFVNNREWPHLRKVINLNASGTTSRPTHMSLPDNVQYMESLKYDKRTLAGDPKNYASVTCLELQDFLDITDGRDSSASEVTTITDNDGTEILIYTDRAPTYYTVIDGKNIVFDAYDSDLESTLQSTKSKAIVYQEPSFTATDAAILDLPDKDFQQFKAELRSIVWNDIVGTPNQKAEQRARRTKVYGAQNKFRTDGGIRKPFNFGR